MLSPKPSIGAAFGVGHEPPADQLDADLIDANHRTDKLDEHRIRLVEYDIWKRWLALGPARWLEVAPLRVGCCCVDVA
jgi:hypothetical protein